MAFDLNSFRAQLKFDGARPNLFEISLVPPAGIQQGGMAGNRIRFFARSAQLPGVSIGSIPVYYMGREIKVPGNKVFQEWVVTIYNDEDMIMRNVFERWMGALNTHATNLRLPGFVNARDYSVDAAVTQYSKIGTGQLGTAGTVVNTPSDLGGGSGLRKYKLVGMWPIDLSPIDLDWGANDAIEEFTVTLAYQWWEVERDPASSIASLTSSG